MRLCSYIVRYDSGLAPNPFWSFCTLAVCTPNHMGIRLQRGDWIIGSTTKQRGNELLCAMELSEIKHFNDYYVDERFSAKKPVKSSTSVERVGDNMYYKDDNGNWKQHPTDCHNTKHDMKKDLKHPYVYIGEKFYYFGENSVRFPVRFQELIRKTQGCRADFPSDLVNKFTSWISSNFEIGIHGEPIDKHHPSNKAFIGINEL